MSDDTCTLLRLPADSSCLGTKPVKIGRKNGDSSSATAGMVATFQCQEKSSPAYLRILVTDGNSSFQGQVHPDQTKVQWDHHAPNMTNAEQSDASRVKILSSFLLQENNERMMISYDWTQDERIKLVLREKLSTGLVRILWPGTLERVDTNVGALAFCSALGACVNEAAAEINQLKKERDTLKADLSGWKDTAEKLDGQWQNEKDVLLGRFLELYKTAHEELGKSRQEVQRLKKQISEARVLGGKKKKAPPAPTFGQPDDHDVELYDAETVARLAGGPAANTAPVEKSDKSASPTAIGARANPHTGALEVWDADALLRDPKFLGLPSEDGEDVHALTKRNSSDVDPNKDEPVAKKLKY